MAGSSAVDASEASTERSARGPSWVRRAVASQWTWILAGTLVLVTAWLPTWRVPVIGDDFYYSLGRYYDYGGSVWTVLANAWHDDLQPNRYNPVGREFSLTNHVLARESSAWWGVDLTYYFRVQTLALIWGAVLAGSFAFRAAVRYVHPSNQVRLWPVFAGLAAGYAVVMQLHINSHDPSITIAEIGYGTPILAFALMTLAFRLVTPPARWPRAAVAYCVLALVGTVYYETFVTAVAACTALFVVEWLRGRLPRRRLLWLVGAGAALPASVALAGRAWVATQDVPYYRGTDLVLGPEGLKVLANFVLGTVPGSAWPHTTFAIGGAPLSVPGIAGGLLIGVLATVIAWGLLRGGMPRLRPGRGLWWVAAVYGAHLIGSFAMQSFTTKYVREIWHHHVVYLAYGTAVIMVATAALVAFAFLPRRGVTRAMPVVLVAITAFAVAQQSVNVAVANHLREVYRGPLLVASEVTTDAGTDATRCAALRELSLGNPFHDMGSFPELAEEINVGYAWDFGMAFCTDTERIVEEAPEPLVPEPQVE
ncbi:hypothetical protein [Demequina muriae]|uniref:Uncharacterized protein n=1 Tax=Demequina muriae TaxID=3051664 RepID=A0ABT8GJZ1_9MICO|nr:hypothetical protein [Demequina sp. EGI L300058]MDN4481754.1 hypothetical protein [Demequina sp. EGI L300058]